MPTYEYTCKSCEESIEAVQAFTDPSLTECAACGGPLRKVFGNVGISFKGSGFYKTDSRGSGVAKPAGEKGEGDGGGDKAGKDGGDKAGKGDGDKADRSSKAERGTGEKGGSQDSSGKSDRSSGSGTSSGSGGSGGSRSGGGGPGNGAKSSPSGSAPTKTA